MIKRRGRPRFKGGRDPRFLKWVRLTQDCLICGGMAEPAHIKSRGAGGKDLGNVLALCRKHHDEQHHQGIETWTARYGLDLQEAADALATKYLKTLRIAPD